MHNIVKKKKKLKFLVIMDQAKNLYLFMVLIKNVTIKITLLFKLIVKEKRLDVIALTCHMLNDIILGVATSFKRYRYIIQFLSQFTH